MALLDYCTRAPVPTHAHTHPPLAHAPSYFSLLKTTLNQFLSRLSSPHPRSVLSPFFCLPLFFLIWQRPHRVCGVLLVCARSTATAMQCYCSCTYCDCILDGSNCCCSLPYACTCLSFIPPHSILLLLPHSFTHSLTRPNLQTANPKKKERKSI